jgi:Fe-S-cluster containining protein
MPDTPEPWFQDGLRFTCTQCGKCCTGAPGVVWVDDDEITKLAAARGMVRHEFIAMFTRKERGRVSLRERPNGDCVFYDAAKGCTVYQHRPKQCRTWPFWDSNLTTPERWAEVEGTCPGSGEGELIPVEEILKRAKQIKM